ncbi:unnamed protein product [Amoebophrya sp. A120]|nr:unnamed protein product [Amoebophrya sp. A120]|eukprot:GSA120T00012125001.1
MASCNPSSSGCARHSTNAVSRGHSVGYNAGINLHHAGQRGRSGSALPLYSSRRFSDEFSLPFYDASSEAASTSSYDVGPLVQPPRVVAEEDFPGDNRFGTRLRSPHGENVFARSEEQHSGNYTGSARPVNMCFRERRRDESCCSSTSTNAHDRDRHSAASTRTSSRQLPSKKSSAPATVIKLRRRRLGCDRGSRKLVVFLFLMGLLLGYFGLKVFRVLQKREAEDRALEKKRDETVAAWRRKISEIRENLEGRKQRILATADDSVRKGRQDLSLCFHLHSWTHAEVMADVHKTLQQLDSISGEINGLAEKDPAPGSLAHLERALKAANEQDTDSSGPPVERTKPEGMKTTAAPLSSSHPRPPVPPPSGQSRSGDGVRTTRERASVTTENNSPHAPSEAEQRQTHTTDSPSTSSSTPSETPSPTSPSSHESSASSTSPSSTRNYETQPTPTATGSSDAKKKTTNTSQEEAFAELEEAVGELATALLKGFGVLSDDYSSESSRTAGNQKKTGTRPAADKKAGAASRSQEPASGSSSTPDDEHEGRDEKEDSTAGQTEENQNSESEKKSEDDKAKAKEKQQQSTSSTTENANNHGDENNQDETENADLYSIFMREFEKGFKESFQKNLKKKLEESVKENVQKYVKRAFSGSSSSATTATASTADSTGSRTTATTTLTSEDERERTSRTSSSSRTKKSEDDDETSEVDTDELRTTDDVMEIKFAVDELEKYVAQEKERMKVERDLEVVPVVKQRSAPASTPGWLGGGIVFAEAAEVPASVVGGGENGEALGDGDEVFFENGIDKSPIRGDSKGGLADDQSFEPPKFAEKFYNDPACEEAGEMWTDYRKAMAVTYDSVEEDEDRKAETSMNFLVDSGMMNTTFMDEQANRCFIGVCTMLYHLSRHRMMVEGVYTSAAYLFRSLDHYLSSLHPGKFDEQNEVPPVVPEALDFKEIDSPSVAEKRKEQRESEDYIEPRVIPKDSKPLWPISDYLVGLLRENIAKRSSGRGWDHGPKQKDQKPYHGNMYGAMANDMIDRDANKTLANAFKIYVYPLDSHKEFKALASGASFCKDNQWGFEVQLHYWFLACDCRTDDPEEADFFFVPQYTACHLNLETFTEEESNAMFVSLVDSLPHFKRTQGRDHVFIWGAGFSVDGPFRQWKEYVKDSIFLMAETEYWNPYHWQTEKPFNFAKDIVLPGRIAIKEIAQHHEHAMAMPDRPWVGDFVGWNRPLHAAQGNETTSPRQALLRWAKRYPSEMHIRQDVPYSEALRGSISSRFCFVPRGKSAWSSRLFRVLYGQCVPVILNDDYEVPFTSLFDNKDNWYVRWPMREVGKELAHFLMNFDLNLVAQMQKNAIEPKCWYVWVPSTLDSGHVELQEGELNPVCPHWRTQNAYLATHTLLYYKKRVTKSSSKTFFMPDPETGEVMYLDENFQRI